MKQISGKLTSRSVTDFSNSDDLCCAQAFFVRWWYEQSDSMKDIVRQLVTEGRLEFVNGGYVQHDEAAAHYVAMIDQTTRGHRWVLCMDRDHGCALAHRGHGSCRL